MEIRIRHIESGESKFLHDGTLEEARDLMAQMRVDGVYCGGEVEHTINCQFVAGDDGAYYEILVGKEG